MLEPNTPTENDPVADALAFRKSIPSVEPIKQVHPLNEVERFLKRFVAYPSTNALVAHVLWIAHTHLMDAWDTTPRIAFLSPEKGSGKSRALEVTALLVPRPIESVNVSPAYLIRKISDQDGRPTLLYDEIDTVFGPKAKNNNEEVRALLNAGYRKHSTVGRCIPSGKEFLTQDLSAYCAVALAGLGYLPDTIHSRSIIINMRRRANYETIEPYRKRHTEQEGEALKQTLEDWCANIKGRVGNPFPGLPEGITDRNADIWESLIAIAGCADEDWSIKASVAAVALVAGSADMVASLGVRLLGDMKLIFVDRESMPTEEILIALRGMPEAPWSDIRGKPIDSRRLADKLSPYGIRPTTIRMRKTTPKGYLRADFIDAWTRYLPSPLEAQHPQQPQK
jgi:hypothetical protein